MDWVTQVPMNKAVGIKIVKLYKYINSLCYSLVFISRKAIEAEHIHIHILEFVPNLLTYFEKNQRQELLQTKFDHNLHV